MFRTRLLLLFTAMLAGCAGCGTGKSIAGAWGPDAGPEYVLYEGGKGVQIESTGETKQLVWKVDNDLITIRVDEFDTLSGRIGLSGDGEHLSIASAAHGVLNFRRYDPDEAIQVARQRIEDRKGAEDAIRKAREKDGRFMNPDRYDELSEANKAALQDNPPPPGR